MPSTPLPAVTDRSVLVVGSANLDVVVPVTRHPVIGETVIGGDHYRATGGKGANQAVACARLGAATSFVGAVGDDDPGRALTAALVEAGVEVSGLHRLDAVPSGLAVIVVDATGENTIVVSPGANDRLTPDLLPLPALAAAGVVLLQLETPLETVAAAAAAATGLVVLNPAPATELPAALLERTDVLVPNRTELALLAGHAAEPRELEEVVALARALEGPSRLVVTLGSDGAVVIDGDQVHTVPARQVTAVDATAAGDTFCGALTVALTEGADLVAAARWAAGAAALAVTRRGAQPSIPTRAEVEAADAR